MASEVPRPEPGDLPGLLRFQAGTCASHGSALYGGLLEQAAADVEASGPTLDVLRGHELDPFGSALALRFMGAVHRIVLSDRAPELAAYYPSVGGHVSQGDPWPVFRDTLARHVEELRDGLSVGVQTNEVGRSAALVLGFLAAARQAGLPLRVLEVGASAGLNLRWDHYRYAGAATAWGDPRSLLAFTDCYVNDPGFGDEPITIAERRGCDPNPIDPTAEAGRLALRAFIWPDQTERMHRLDVACSIAASVPAAIDAAPGADWLRDQLVHPSRDVATVVFHSIVLQYVGRKAREQLDQVFGEAGAAATKATPLFRLTFEPGSVRDRADVRLHGWPGGAPVLLARSTFHGQSIDVL